MCNNNNSISVKSQRKSNCFISSSVLPYSSVVKPQAALFWTDVRKATLRLDLTLICNTSNFAAANGVKQKNAATIGAPSVC